MEGAIPRVPAKHFVPLSEERVVWFRLHDEPVPGLLPRLHFCDSRSACYGVQDFDTVRQGERPGPLEADLRVTRRRGVVLTGSMGDPYNPFEPAERLTRGALNLFCRYGFGAVVLTKSDLVLNDLGLLFAPGGAGAGGGDVQHYRPGRRTMPPGGAARAPHLGLAGRPARAVRGRGAVRRGADADPALFGGHPRNVTGIVHAASSRGRSVLLCGRPGRFWGDPADRPAGVFSLGACAALSRDGNTVQKGLWIQIFLRQPARVGNLQAAFEAACREEGLEWRLPGSRGSSRGRAQPDDVFITDCDVRSRQMEFQKTI